MQDIEADATAVEVAVDMDVVTGINADIDMEVDVRVDVEDEVEDEVESSDRGTMEVRVDVVARIDILDGILMPDVRIEDIKTGQRELESRSLIAGGERASLLEQRAMSCAVERDYHSFCDDDNGNGGNGNGGNGNGRDRNGGDGNGGNGNPNENDRGVRLVARECTYQDFMKCQPLNFKGTERVVGLIRWFEKMETNSHKRTIGTDAAFFMSWIELMKLMAEVYCPRTKIQKMESELYNLTVKNNDLAVYTQRFQELTMMCTKMVPEEEDRVEKFIGGLPNNIQGNVIVAEPTRLQDAVRIANNLMDQKLKGYAMKNAENKRKFDNSQRDNRGQQPPNKRHNVGGQNVARAYTTGNNERRVYNGPLPLCNKCKFHHEVPYTMRCGKSDYPKLKDQNRRNKTGNKNSVGEARGKSYVLGGGDAIPNLNVVTGTFLLNNHYASMLFDSSTDRIFVSTTFSTLLDITPDTLDVSYAVELADERISETNTVLRGYTLGLLGHPFNIDLMLVKLGSFNVIIGMD
ncbi:reverse transcriptase domain-containing protein, partial [Tanacetum coccineum]